MYPLELNLRSCSMCARRLRVSLSAAHSTEDVRQLAAALRRCGLPMSKQPTASEPAPLTVFASSPVRGSSAATPMAPSPMKESSEAEPCEEGLRRSAPAASHVQLASRLTAGTSRLFGDARMLQADEVLCNQLLPVQATGSADSLRSRL